MRTRLRDARRLLTAMGIIVAFTACSADRAVSGTDSAPVTLLSVSPTAGLTGVSVTMPMTMHFSAPLGTGMELYMAVHEGSVVGAQVSGHWSWSTDRRTMTFTPDAPLKARTTYVIHMGGGMRAATGASLNYSTCVGLGGRSVSSTMMSGAGGGMMGEGWKGSDGNFGVIFTFTMA